MTGQFVRRLIYSWGVVDSPRSEAFFDLYFLEALGLILTWFYKPTWIEAKMATMAVLD